MTLSTEEGWAEADYAIGSLYRLVEGGVKTADLDKADKNSAPRTAVGIKADGTVIFYTVDGRQTGYSKGLTFNELADRLLELGCVEAGALDGGGSTNIQARLAGQDTYKLINSPSLDRRGRSPSTLCLRRKNEARALRKLCLYSPTSSCC
jgi:exopolysaccharide biosynthesis protein